MDANTILAVAAILTAIGGMIKGWYDSRRSMRGADIESLNSIVDQLQAEIERRNERVIVLEKRLDQLEEERTKYLARFSIAEGKLSVANERIDMLELKFTQSIQVVNELSKQLIDLGQKPIARMTDTGPLGQVGYRS